MALSSNIISVTTVKNALGETSNVVKTLCTSDKINALSKWRPLNKSGASITQSDVNSRVVNIPVVTPSSLASNLATWSTTLLTHPTNNLRLGDFRNYENGGNNAFNVTISSSGSGASVSFTFNGTASIGATTNNNVYTLRELLSNKGLPNNPTVGVAIYYKTDTSSVYTYHKYVSNIQAGALNGMAKIDMSHLSDLPSNVSSVYLLPMFDPNSTGSNLVPSLIKSGNVYKLNYLQIDDLSFGFDGTITPMLEDIIGPGYNGNIKIAFNATGANGGTFNTITLEIREYGYGVLRHTDTIFNGTETIAPGDVKLIEGNFKYHYFDTKAREAGTYILKVDGEEVYRGELPITRMIFKGELSQDISSAIFVPFLDGGGGNTPYFDAAFGTNYYYSHPLGYGSNHIDVNPFICNDITDTVGGKSRLLTIYPIGTTVSIYSPNSPNSWEHKLDFSLYPQNEVIIPINVPQIQYSNSLLFD